MPLTESEIQAILAGTTFGTPQSVGVMDVIPIIEDEDDQDNDWAAPNFEAGTSTYGRVNVRNLDTRRPTIIPTGAGFVTEELAQDHALPSGYLMKPGERYSCDNAMCIQQSQGGLIRHSDQTPMVILPAELRTKLLQTRRGTEYSRMWASISDMLHRYGVKSYGGNVVDFINHFAKELDQFVAQFELVPNQVGAVIFINNHLAGLERAPNETYWSKVWAPLIRLCYGSLAIMAAQKHIELSALRPRPLPEAITSLIDLQKQLKIQQEVVEQKLQVLSTSLRTLRITEDPFPDSQLEDAVLTTVSSGTSPIGQIVRKGSRIPYASFVTPVP